MNLEWKGRFAFLDIFMGHAQFPSHDGRGRAKGRPGVCGPTGQTTCEGTMWPEFKVGKTILQRGQFDLV